MRSVSHVLWIDTLVIIAFMQNLKVGVVPINHALTNNTVQ